MIELDEFRAVTGKGAASVNDAERRRRFERLFDENFRKLLGYALRRVADKTIAADIVAETFLVAWRRLDDVPHGDEARLWLYGTARRVLANHHRGERRRSGLVDKLGAHLDLTLPEASEEALDVRAALDRLDDADAELLRLSVWEGLTPAELATMYGVPPATMRTRLHRARARLREQLDAKRSVASGHEGYDGRPPVRDTEEES